MRTLYTSDSHIGHRNIITYANRPFESVEAMDAALVANLRAAAAQPDTRIIHAGDLLFYFKDELFHEPFPNREHNILLVGNHDRWLKSKRQRELVQQWFGTIVGRRDDWRTNRLTVDDNGILVLVSHHPQRELRGHAYNLYGHVHNNVIQPTPEQIAYWNEHPGSDDRWLHTVTDTHHNICVETTEYRPMTLNELLARVDV